ncbi:MAG: hypothetical protein LC800_22240 [Acidobacteria bacterium]|nr:hypothetical protein [Acidobacteriota bacterium]
MREQAATGAEPKTRAINFRIPERVWKAAEERATLAGKSVNEWARDELTARLDEAHGLTPGERLIYVEINNIRNLIETMMLAGMDAANKGAYAEALEQSIDAREVAAREYFSQLAAVGGAACDGQAGFGGQGGTVS